MTKLSFQEFCSIILHCVSWSVSLSRFTASQAILSQVRSITVSVLRIAPIPLPASIFRRQGFASNHSAPQNLVPLQNVSSIPSVNPHFYFSYGLFTKFPLNQVPCLKFFPVKFPCSSKQIPRPAADCSSIPPVNLPLLPAPSLEISS